MINKITLKLDELRKAPQTIGVYEFIGKYDAPLYIGKAVNIKARLASHKQNAKYDLKEKAFFEAATKVKITPTESEFKALLLEADLIKEKKPRYNKIWRDDKSHLYIEVTAEEYPKILLARKTDIRTRDKSKNQFFGPFQSKRVAQDLTREIRKVIPFCTRKQIGKNPCFHSKIGLCDPCPNKISGIQNNSQKAQMKRQYRKNIRQVIRTLKGQTKPVIKDLQKQLNAFSSKQKYEEALVMRNRLMRFERLIYQTLGIKEENLSQVDAEKALESLKELLLEHYPEISDLRRIEAYDVSNISQKQATASMVVLTNGQVDKSQYRKFKVATSNQKPANRLGDVGMIEQVIKRRLRNSWPKPNLIVVDGGKPQVRAVEKAFKDKEKNFPVIGIAKAPDRLIVGVGKLPTVHLPQNHPGFNLIRLARDESHRFSRRYHLFLRKKELFT